MKNRKNNKIVKNKFNKNESNWKKWKKYKWYCILEGFILGKKILVFLLIVFITTTIISGTFFLLGFTTKEEKKQEVDKTMLMHLEALEKQDKDLVLKTVDDRLKENVLRLISNKIVIENVEEVRKNGLMEEYRFYKGGNIDIDDVKIYKVIMNIEASEANNKIRTGKTTWNYFLIKTENGFIIDDLGI